MSTVTKERTEKRTRTFQLQNVEVRGAADGGLHITGRAAVFGQASEDLGGFRERIQRGAFKQALADSPDVVLLQNHDPNLVLARTTSGTLRVYEDPSGLCIDAQAGDTSYARDLAVTMKRGDVSQMSFAFTVAPDGETWERGGGKRQVTVTEVERLFDVSVVTQPAYPTTSAKVRKRDMAVHPARRASLLTKAEASLSAARRTTR
ncbi:MAG: HK97 family phage prohead protease [Solirubrobacteraceae bacterium]